jgi:hypothetical protein
MTNDTKQLAWLVDARNDVQRFMLEVHTRAPELDVGAIEYDGDRSRRWQWLVGVAFSLWRAVFLLVDIEGPRAAGSAGRDAKEFLAKVIETNAIGFGDDRTRSAWSSGYYLNNVRLRLDKLWADLGESKTENPGLTDADMRGRWAAALVDAQRALDRVCPRDVRRSHE